MQLRVNCAYESSGSSWFEKFTLCWDQSHHTTYRMSHTNHPPSTQSRSTHDARCMQHTHRYVAQAQENMWRAKGMMDRCVEKEAWTHSHKGAIRIDGCMGVRDLYVCTCVQLFSSHVFSPVIQLLPDSIPMTGVQVQSVTVRECVDSDAPCACACMTRAVLLPHQKRTHGVNCSWHDWCVYICICVFIDSKRSVRQSMRTQGYNDRWYTVGGEMRIAPCMYACAPTTLFQNAPFEWSIARTLVSDRSAIRMRYRLIVPEVLQRKPLTRLSEFGKQGRAYQWTTYYLVENRRVMRACVDRIGTPVKDIYIGTCSSDQLHTHDLTRHDKYRLWASTRMSTGWGFSLVSQQCVPLFSIGTWARRWKTTSH